jgi:CubicO group peptidase (beta-lactamase class C family)
MKIIPAHARYYLIIFLAFTLFRLPAIAASDTEITGTWTGSIALPGTELNIVVKISQFGEDGHEGTIDIPAQGASDLPLTEFRYDHPSIGFTISGVPGNPTFDGALDDGEITGMFTQGGQSFPFTLTRQSEEEVRRDTERFSGILENIAAFIDTTRISWNVPGVAVAIVKDDEVVFSRGFGNRDVENTLPVTPQTLFPIGSSSKAFTALGLKILEADGLIDIDAEVRDYLPDFRMYDTYRTEKLTPRDLVTHRSGLPRHDYVWYGSPFSREELYKRIRYLQPNKDLRTTFQYQNLMYMTAGYLIGKLSDSSWEDFTRERILEPLGMLNTNFSVIETQQSDDHALPYRLGDDNVAEKIPYRDLTAIGPAGSINSSVTDMASWVRFNLGDGTFNGEQLVSSSELRDMQSPHFVISGRVEHNEVLNRSYGLGWFVESYRGYYYIHHGGNIDGFSALVTLIPTEKIGVVVLTNLNANPLPNIISRYAADLLLGLDPVDWHGRSKGATGEEDEEEETRKEVDRIEGTKPSHELRAYAGEYEHPGYGIVTIELRGNNLVAMYNSFSMTMEHWHYNVFRATEETIPDMKVFITFAPNVKGDIENLSVPLEPLAEEIVFTRMPSRDWFDTVYLSQFIGEYELPGLTLRIDRGPGQTIALFVPGQSSYTLEPYKEYEFNTRGLAGYSVRFIVDEQGAVTALDLIQPNGVFTAKRK